MVTPAQEAISIAMLSSIIACGAMGYVLLRVLALADTPSAALLFVVASFVVTAYIVPRVTACWLDRPLDDILEQ